MTTFGMRVVEPYLGRTELGVLRRDRKDLRVVNYHILFGLLARLISCVLRHMPGVLRRDR